MWAWVFSSVVIVYLSGRSFWMDEASLWGNLAGKRIFDFSEPLAGDQLAPLGVLDRATGLDVGAGHFDIRVPAASTGRAESLSLFLFAAWLAESCPAGPH